MAETSSGLRQSGRSNQIEFLNDVVGFAEVPQDVLKVTAGTDRFTRVLECSRILLVPRGEKQFLSASFCPAALGFEEHKHACLTIAKGASG